MALLAESFLEERLNQDAFFAIPGVKHRHCWLATGGFVVPLLTWADVGLATSP